MMGPFELSRRLMAGALLYVAIALEAWSARVDIRRRCARCDVLYAQQHLGADGLCNGCGAVWCPRATDRIEA